MFTSGFVKVSKMSEEDKGSLKRGALIGAGLGAVKNVATDAIVRIREGKVKNSKGAAAFKKNLKPGDILLLGSTARHSGAVRTGDLPKGLQKITKKLGLTSKSKLLTNSTLLNSVGAGSKYHAGIYLGKGRVGHMTTDLGAVSEPLSTVLKGQNAAAYRLKENVKGAKQQAASAVKFTRKAIKDKVPYEGAKEYIKEPLANIALPDVARRACRDTSKGMVCHTLPSMAYSKQKFSQGRRTYSGDLRKNFSFQPVARKDTVKIPLGARIRGHLGQAGKGLAYALPGAAIGYGIHKYRQHKKENK